MLSISSRNSLSRFCAATRESLEMEPAGSRTRSQKIPSMVLSDSATDAPRSVNGAGSAKKLFRRSSAKAGFSRASRQEQSSTLCRKLGLERKEIRRWREDEDEPCRSFVWDVGHTAGFD